MQALQTLTSLREYFPKFSKKNRNYWVTCLPGKLVWTCVFTSNNESRWKIHFTSIRVLALTASSGCNPEKIRLFSAVKVSDDDVLWFVFEFVKFGYKYNRVVGLGLYPRVAGD
jgi:hypothetical protein